MLSQHLESVYALRLIHDEPACLGYLLKERVVEVSVLLDDGGRARAECPRAGAPGRAPGHGHRAVRRVGVTGPAQWGQT